ncbi:zinc ribbon domain-containing protein [Desulfosarcina ovata]|uniref:Zinc ribbon domain-containing protein n=1 Tax=Desulfosarcina ovata subsp. ovata TaxID=2752305 RepID=A0A5K8AK28_9BACT|nr:zinc ribbon domain-containing protein [Desulfosarcina ovata]BBO93073.1 hypothetical protein DSCOOX_62530 [Desulfosarcina ovata subsp. ovata]
MAAIKCENCGKMISDKGKTCPYCNIPLALPKKKSVFPKWVVVVISLVLLAASISFVAYSRYQYKQKRINENFDFSMRMISGDLFRMAQKSDLIVVEINNAWREAIFSETNKRDFNEAIVDVKESRSEDIKELIKLSASIEKSLKETVIPEGKQLQFDKIKEFYLLEFSKNSAGHYSQYVR